MTNLRGVYAGVQVPARLALDDAGNLYATEPSSGAVVVRSPEGRLLERVEGLGRPVGIAVRGGGEGDPRTVYLGDAGDGSVTAYDASWVPQGQLGDGPGEFGMPADLAIDPATGRVYVADTARDLVAAYLPGSEPQRVVGLFNAPSGVFFDAGSGELLVSAGALEYLGEIFDFSSFEYVPNYTGGFYVFVFDRELNYVT
ncbi:MAG TPA: hypothetical protein VIX81_09440, partial [Gammaproteobacteria bacterium]